MKVVSINRIHFGGNAQRKPHPFCDFDRVIRPLFWRDAPEERQVLPRFGMEPVEVAWQAVMHRGLPVCPLERSALGVGDRNQRHFGKLLVQRDEIGQIQPSV